ncbi:MAG: DUF1904 family protein [Eubacteriales bacterium]
MPQLTFKGLSDAQVQTISQNLAPQLSTLMNTPEDWFTFEYSPIISYVSGKKVQREAIVDVRWFERGQDVQDQAAVLITNSLKELGYQEPTVVFHPLKKENFYENGEHY